MASQGMDEPIPKRPKEKKLAIRSGQTTPKSNGGGSATPRPAGLG
jgi:hypothetical protein